MTKVKSYIIVTLTIVVLLVFIRYYKKYQKEYYPDGQLKLYALENFHNEVKFKYYYPNGSVKIRSKKVKDKAEFYEYVEYFQGGNVKSYALCKNPKRRLFKSISFVDTLVSYYESGIIHKKAQIDKSCKASGRIKAYYPNGELMLSGVQHNDNYTDLLVYYSLDRDSIIYTFYGDDINEKSKLITTKRRQTELIDYSYGFTIKINSEIDTPNFHSRKFLTISNDEKGKGFSVFVDTTNDGLKDYVDANKLNFIKSILFEDLGALRIKKLPLNEDQNIFKDSYQLTSDQSPNFEAILVVCRSKSNNNLINLLYYNLKHKINFEEIEESLLSLKFIDDK